MFLNIFNPCYYAFYNYYIESIAEFAVFNAVKNQTDIIFIKDGFLNLLKNSNKNTVFNTLYELLQTVGKKLKLSVFKALDIEVYLVIIHGSHDEILQQCGTSHGLPRGCPIIYIPETNYIKINGFYPKFTNTDKGNNFKEELQKVIDSKEEPITSISINMKVSGFLGIIIAFSYKGKKYWTVTTKKAADYEHEAGFIKKAKNIIENSMTCEIVTHLIEKELCLCGEFLSPEDNTHGYITKNSLFIPTCIGKTVSNQCELFVGKIMFYYTLPEIYEFCLKFNLSCGDQYKFNSSDPKIIAEFLKEFFQGYSLITASKLETRIQELKEKYSDTFNILPGSFLHSKDISNIIEGCILFIGNKMLKVKFGLYVIATMFFRPYINKSSSYNATSFCSRWIEETHSLDFIKMCNLGTKIIDKSPEILPAIVRDQVYELFCDNKIELEIKSKKKCTIILIVGPVGSGKTTMGENIAKQGNVKCPTIHVDGDIIYNMDAKIFGKHRNFATMSTIYKLITDGYNIVFSLGGGVCLGGYKTPYFSFLERLQTIFPDVDFELSLIYFSSELDEIKICESDAIQIGISDISHYKEVVKLRHSQLSVSEQDKLVKIYFDVSKKNAELVRQHFSPDYFVKIIGVPFKYCELNIEQILPNFIPCSKNLEFHYYRIYHIVSCPQIDQLLHITLGYSKTPLNPALKGKYKDGEIISGKCHEIYYRKNDESNIQIYSVVELPDNQHITIHSGSAPPEISKELLNNLSSESFTIVRGKDSFTFFSDQPVNYKRKTVQLPSELTFTVLCTIYGGLSE